MNAGHKRNRDEEGSGNSVLKGGSDSVVEGSGSGVNEGSISVDEGGERDVPAPEALGSTITTPFNIFATYLNGEPIGEVEHASIAELAMVSLGRLLGESATNEQRMAICRLMLQRVNTSDLPSDGVLSRRVHESLYPRRCLHEYAIHWFLWHFAEACGIDACFESPPNFQSPWPKGRGCPLALGQHKTRVFIFGGACMDIIRDMNSSSDPNPTVRKTNRYLDPIKRDRIGLGIYFKDNHFISVALDTRNAREAKMSSRNSFRHLFPPELEPRVKAVLQARTANQYLSVRNAPDVEQESLECGPRSLLNVCDDALAISKGANDVFLLDPGSKRAHLVAKFKSMRERTSNKEWLEYTAIVNANSDAVRQLLTLGLLKAMSVALPQPLFQNFEEAIHEAVQDVFNKDQYERWLRARRDKGPPAAALATIAGAEAGAEAVDLQRGGKASHLKLHSPILFYIPVAP